LTGRSPGEHGLFDFTQKIEGQYRVRFTNATDRVGATLFRRVSDAGGAVLALGMPTTFPPEPLRGLAVCGFDAPVSRGTSGRSASDPALYESIAARTGPWMVPDLDEGADSDAWHEHALDVLLGRIARKEAFGLEALAQLRARGDDPTLFCVVFSESDTVCHHFWRDHDAASPRHDPGASRRRRNAVAMVYERLDAACGAFRRAFGAEAACFVVSDHGAGGAARRVVHLNRQLEACGLLVRRGGGAGLDGFARGVRDLALRILPDRASEAIFRRIRPAAARLESAARFGGLDWTKTVAFSEEVNTQPGIWINLMGREAQGCVAAADYEATRRRVIDALSDWKLPGGERVVARARRREDVYAGDYVSRAPDIVIELGLEAGYALSLVATPWQEEPEPVRTLADHECAGGRGRGMNGTHRPEGVWVEWPSPKAPLAPPGSIVETHERVLRALGLGDVPSAGDATAPEPRAPYDDADEAEIRDRLKRLGYLE
jgi:predicted AlkP superfamily phosphohydrolase/phosphomutase